MSEPTSDDPRANDAPPDAEPSPPEEAPSGAESAGFDAVAAAAELAVSLGEEAAPAPTAEMILSREVLELTKLIDTRNQEIAVANKRAQVAEEEVDRVKERVEREAAKQLVARSRKVLLAMLEVMDDLDRALVSIREDVAEGEATQEVVRGVELVRSSLLTKLSSFGVSHRPCEGERFDPSFHEALSAVPVTDEAQNGVIVGVLRQGYMIGEELLRAAGVAVGRYSS